MGGSNTNAAAPYQSQYPTGTSVYAPGYNGMPYQGMPNGTGMQPYYGAGNAFTQPQATPTPSSTPAMPANTYAAYNQYGQPANNIQSYGVGSNPTGYGSDGPGNPAIQSFINGLGPQPANAPKDLRGQPLLWNGSAWGQVGTVSGSPMFTPYSMDALKQGTGGQAGPVHAQSTSNGGTSNGVLMIPGSLPASLTTGGASLADYQAYLAANPNVANYTMNNGQWMPNGNFPAI